MEVAAGSTAALAAGGVQKRVLTAVLVEEQCKNLRALYARGVCQWLLLYILH
jgi:hypothetical protein